MRLLKELIARRANRGDHVNGHFCATRFGCNPLLDETAGLQEEATQTMLAQADSSSFVELPNWYPHRPAHALV